MATINISLPQSMYEDAKKMLKKKRYTSISELVRDGLRKVLYPEITENGFTTEFEEEVLRSASEPRDESKVWETDKDVHLFFDKLKKEMKAKKNNDKG